MKEADADKDNFINMDEFEEVRHFEYKQRYYSGGD